MIEIDTKLILHKGVFYMTLTVAQKIVNIAQNKIIVQAGQIAALSAQLAEAKAKPPVGSEELAAALALAGEAQKRYEDLVNAEEIEDAEDEAVLANFVESLGGDLVSQESDPAESDEDDDYEDEDEEV
jgi:hypothetical protein